jgi:hypothetical protein
MYKREEKEKKEPGVVCGGEGKIKKRDIPHDRDYPKFMSTPRIGCCFQHLTSEYMVPRSQIRSNINPPIHQPPISLNLFYRSSNLAKAKDRKQMKGEGRDRKEGEGRRHTSQY